MRDLVLYTTAVGARNAFNPALQKPKTGMPTEFLATFKQHLHAHANTDHRPPGRDNALHWIDETSCLKLP